MALSGLIIFTCIFSPATLLADNPQEDKTMENEMDVVNLLTIQYRDLPATRFIGRNVRGGPQQFGEMWGRSGEFLPALNAMNEHHADITEPCALMHFHNKNNDAPGNEMAYIIGRFMKAGTPVPEGYDFWDMPASTVGLGIIRGEFDNLFKKGFRLTMDKIIADGYEITYPQNFFQAEVYVKENIPKGGVVSNLGILFACRKKEVGGLFGELPKPATPDELRAYAATRADPEKKSNKIAGIRKLWRDDVAENFFLEGCFTAVVKAAGGAPEYDYLFFLTVGGTIFTQHYGQGCDGLASLLGHRIVPHLFKQCGYTYLYIDRATLDSEPALTLDAIKTAIDKGIPVMSWGVANLPLRKGSENHKPWCNIGGYGEDGVLYVNAYPQDESMDTDGYFTVKNGLASSDGLYILLEKTDAPSVRDVYREAVRSIPAFLSLPPYRGASFGAQAYTDWADTLVKELDWEGDAVPWDFHKAPWVTAMTIEHYMRMHFDRVIRASEFSLAEKVKAAYAKIYAGLREINRLHGGMFPSRETITNPEVRKELAAALREMGDAHKELLALFTEENLKTEEKPTW